MVLQLFNNGGSWFYIHQITFCLPNNANPNGLFFNLQLFSLFDDKIPIFLILVINLNILSIILLKSLAVNIIRFFFARFNYIT